MFTLLFSCSGSKGTEVANTPTPETTKNPTTKHTVETPYYDYTITIPNDWIFVDYLKENKTPGAEAFADIDPATITGVYFERKDLAFITVFSSKLAQDETLEQFVRKRRPEGEINLQSLMVDGVTVTT